MIKTAKLTGRHSRKGHAPRLYLYYPLNPEIAQRVSAYVAWHCRATESLRTLNPAYFLEVAPDIISEGVAALYDPDLWHAAVSNRKTGQPISKRRRAFVVASRAIDAAIKRESRQYPYGLGTLTDLDDAYRGAANLYDGVVADKVEEAFRLLLDTAAVLPSKPTRDAATLLLRRAMGAGESTRSIAGKYRSKAQDWIRGEIADMML
jgi:hypothetical protein